MHLCHHHPGDLAQFDEFLSFLGCKSFGRTCLTKFHHFFLNNSMSEYGNGSKHDVIIGHRCIYTYNPGTLDNGIKQNSVVLYLELSIVNSLPNVDEGPRLQILFMNNHVSRSAHAHIFL